MNKKKKPGEVSALRKKAEQKLLKQSNKLSKQPSQDIQRTIHELQVHQLELEMQNEELRRAHEEIEESRSKYADLYDFAPLGYFTFDKNGIILESNLAGATLLKRERGVLIKKPFSIFIHPKHRNTFYLHAREVFETMARQTCEIILQLKPDTQTYIQKYVQLESIPARDNKGSFSLLRTAISDISDRKLAEGRLLQSKEEWEKTFNTIPDSVIVTDGQFRILRANRATAQIFGFKQEDLAGMFCYNVIHRTDKPPADCPHSVAIRTKKEQKNEVFEANVKRHFVLTSTPILDSEGRVTSVVEVYHDISDRKKIEHKLKEVAITDDLTGLFNRRGFLTLSEQHCRTADRTGTKMYLLYLDLNGLKIINDNLGHEEGDKALIDTASILKKTFRKSDIIGRIGGDEFAVLISEISGSNVEKVITGNIEKNLKIHNEKYGRKHDLSLSMGFTHFVPGTSCSISGLLSKADLLMYEDKKHEKHEKNIMKTIRETRLHKRYSNNGYYRAVLDLNKSVQIKDLSQGGICLATSQPLTARSVHSIKIFSSKADDLTLMGTVVWSASSTKTDEESKDPSSYAAGFMFTESNDIIRNSLDKFIKTLAD
jgi:diguanylate cyclase (GGDEF)-like protein/PAS domain S-box-containing protein